MTEIFEKATFQNRIPIGGICTERIYLGADGSVTGQGDLGIGNFVFCIKAEKGASTVDARVLQTSSAKGLHLGVFENAECTCKFPFASLRFSDSSFPAEVRLCCFSPFIPLGDTDSGIPAAMFEFEITNKSSERLDYSFCALADAFSGGSGRMGCTDTGEAYIFLSEGMFDGKNVCVSTDGKNISFCERMDKASFTEAFITSPTLENNPSVSGEDFCGALCTHFSLSSGEAAKVRFCISLYSPIGKYTRNYYAQYFESSMECASYFFRHSERLKSESKAFSDTVFSSTLPEEMLEKVNSALTCLIEKTPCRLSGGALYSEDFPESLSETYGLSLLFPHVEYSQVSYLIKNFSDCFGGIDFSAMPERYDEDNQPVYDCKKQLLCILRCARFFKNCSDTELLIEDWFYISRCIDFFFDNENPSRYDTNGDGKLIYPELQPLYARVLEEGVLLAARAGDKKRSEQYDSLYKNASKESDHMEIDDCDCNLAILSEMSGFSYDSSSKSIRFSPKSDECPLDFGGTFRCFFCTADAYGYVEEGIDYIEINLIGGRLTLRSFGVPRKPRLVQYGGRNWRFTDNGLCAYLDSDLEISPQKKLTILIDIKE